MIRIEKIDPQLNIEENLILAVRFGDVYLSLEQHARLKRELGHSIQMVGDGVRVAGPMGWTYVYPSESTPTDEIHTYNGCLRNDAEQPQNSRYSMKHAKNE